MKIRLLIFFSIAHLGLHAQWVNSRDQQEPDIQQQVWRLTEVMFHDVVNPPAATRFYAYSLLAGYEILYQADSTIPSFRRSLAQYPVIQTTLNQMTVNKELAVQYGILETGKAIIPSGYLLEAYQQQLVDAFKRKKLSKEIIDASVGLAKEIAKQIILYAKSDGYFKLSTRPRYKPLDTQGSWQPTAPEYMAAVESHWSTIRPFFLDSASQFKPVSPVSFDTSSRSGFMQLVKEVYSTTKNLTAEQKLIADFWDCNPFAVQFEGHMSIGLKKISPGGHWMSITGIASKKAQLDLPHTILLYSLVAMTLHDAFISCWDEKYRSNRIRPEHAINKYVDPLWKPLLQTPPFPEYSSGHSVISTASAEVLTYFLGDDFSFVDSTETYIGLPARNFSSFREAAAEARMSRLYGGIHFRDAIENGGEQGKRLGEFILQKLQLKPF